VSTSLPAGSHADLLGGGNVDVDDHGRIETSVEPLSVVAVLAHTE
jgi:hypothetical protein